MDLITKAIQDVKYAIPREVLRMAYMDKPVNGFVPLAKNLESAIRDMTILPRVIVDTDIAGGQTILVSLAGLNAKEIDDYNYIFEIPPERVDNRTILSVMAVNYYRSINAQGSRSDVMAGISPASGNDLSSSTQRAMNSRGSIPVVSTAECQVVGHNVIMIRNHLRTAAMAEIRCRVENDQNLSNLPITVAPMFSKLCTFAVKAFIYNELIVKIDRGVIDRGHEIGALKNIIESYSDAEENYRTCRDEEWGAVATMCDTVTYHDLLKMQMFPSM